MIKLDIPDTEFPVFGEGFEIEIIPMLPSNLCQVVIWRSEGIPVYKKLVQFPYKLKLEEFEISRRMDSTMEVESK